MFYPGSALERAMRIQEVVMRAIAGEIQWFQAAEILGVSCRTIRRWKTHFEVAGYDAFIDRRRQHPSPKRVAVAVVQDVVRLYRDHLSLWHGPRPIGWYDEAGQLLPKAPKLGRGKGAAA